MALKAPRFWTRLAQVVRRKSRAGTEGPVLPAVGEDGLLVDPVEMPDALGLETEMAPERTSAAGPLARWSRREQTLSKLQEGYDRLNQVIEQIQKHLEQQGERTDRICNSLEQLARSMSDLPNVGRKQVQTLEAITAQIESGNVRMQQIASAVDEVPKASRAQTETLAGINRTLEMTGEQNLVTAQTLEKLGLTLGALGESNATQIEVLKQMGSKADTQADQLGGLIARQSRRFLMLFIVTIVLAAAAITVAVLSLVLR